MFEGFQEIIGIVPQGQARFVDRYDCQLTDVQVGSTLVAPDPTWKNFLAAYLAVNINDQHAILPKDVFRSFPLERRTHYSAEQIATLDKSPLERSLHIHAMSETMSQERAEGIIAAVLAAINNAQILPASPFRKTDNVQTAGIVVEAADLKHRLNIGHIPHVSDDPDSKGHKVYLSNISDAVTKLMRLNS